ncbi:hypothetical protein HELRODRAFT_158732 [Helobdella robusta]|uniref:Uncharacterized protein n=1 Tax=Helobdella robusta TaxID=6412 RepID=T1EN61_HELRO|nr:hypothetical protein HELRODRAFT_158732 [Helobdella robusta]ESO12254.1 hypothetical protein HELRODRAFT_158732 [Helobdella robusta]
MDTSGSWLSGEIANLKSELGISFASVVSGEMEKSVQSINQDVKNVQKKLGKKNDSVIRPILIKFNNIEAKSLVFNGIRKMKSLNGDLACARLSHDLSIDQKAVLKKLLNEARVVEEGCKEGFFLYRVKGEVGRWKIVRFRKEK